MGKEKIENITLKNSETKREKRNRVEREAYNIIKKVYGNCEIVQDNFGKDSFGIADIMVMNPQIKFIQVKANHLNKNKYEDLLSKMLFLNKIDFDIVSFEIWVREDYKGWKFYKPQVSSTQEGELLEVNIFEYDQILNVIQVK